MVYLDEAGISNPAQEPYVVVAGVLVHADRVWQALEARLNELVLQYVPPEKQEGFWFHATELFSGGKNFPRDEWGREERWKILDELVALPRRLKLPVIAGWVERAKLATKYPGLDTTALSINAQTIAFAICTYGIDLYMRQGLDVAEGEVAAIVMENNDQARSQIRKFHDFNRNPKNHTLLKSKNFGEFAIQRIIGTPHFEEKGGSSPLQLADVCAFAVKRHLMRTPESERFYSPLKSSMILLDKAELPASPSITAL
jgi:hypothetical protein